MPLERLEIGTEVVHRGAQRLALARRRLQQDVGGVVGQQIQHRQQGLTDLAHRGAVAALLHA